MKASRLQFMFFMANILVLFAIMIVVVLATGDFVIKNLDKKATYLSGYFIFALITFVKIVIDFHLINSNEKLQRLNQELILRLKRLQGQADNEQT